VLVCLGGHLTVSGLHHVALISPCGDHVLEHASTDALRIPVSQEDLTPEALSTLRALLASPPLCCNPRRRSKDCGGGGPVTFLEATEVEEFDGEEDPDEWVPTVQAFVIGGPRGGKRKR
jgi:hypothetical protein